MEALKLLLVQPPMKDYGLIKKGEKQERFYRASTEPLGLEYLAAYVRMKCANRINIKIVDFDFSRSDFKQIRNYFRGNMADIIGIACNFAAAVPYAMRVAEIAKKETGAFCMTGGVQATFICEELLEKSYIDIVVLYEGEKTILEVVKNFRQGKLPELQGVASRPQLAKNKPLRRGSFIENLNALPLPARDLLPTKEYLAKYGKLYLSSSRGCPYQCIYCACSAFSRRKFRARSAENVLGEITELKEKYNAPRVSFTDDIFTMDRRRVETLCALLQKSKIDISWDCHARIDTVDASLMQKMKDAGCVEIKFGIESGSQKVVDFIKRSYQLEQAREIVKTANKIGFKSVRTCFMLGIPGETEDSIEETINFAIDLNPDTVEFVIPMPFPGTALRDFAKNEGLLIESDWGKYRHGHIVIKPPFGNPKNFISIQKEAYEKFYFRKEYIETQLKRGKNMKEIIGFLSSWWNEIQQLGETNIEG